MPQSPLPSAAASAQALIAEVEALNRDLALPICLRDAGIAETHHCVHFFLFDHFVGHGNANLRPGLVVTLDELDPSAQDPAHLVDVGKEYPGAAGTPHSHQRKRSCYARQTRAE